MVKLGGEGVWTMTIIRYEVYLLFVRSVGVGRKLVHRVDRKQEMWRHFIRPYPDRLLGLFP